MLPLILTVLNRDDGMILGGVLQSLLRTVSIRGNIPSSGSCESLKNEASALLGSACSSPRRCRDED